MKQLLLASALLALTLSANDDHRKGGKGGDPPMSQTPEPGTWALTAGGFVALILARRARKAK